MDGRSIPAGGASANRSKLTIHPPYIKQTQQAAGCLPRFTTQGLANTLNAFAKFSFDPGARFWQRVGLLLFTTNDNERTKATLSLTLFEVRTNSACTISLISWCPPNQA